MIPERLGDTASFLSGKAFPVLMGSSKLFNMTCVITLVLLLLPWFYITHLLFSLPQSSTFGKIIRLSDSCVWCPPKSLVLIRKASPLKTLLCSASSQLQRGEIKQSAFPSIPRLGWCFQVKNLSKSEWHKGRFCDPAWHSPLERELLLKN